MERLEVQTHSAFLYELLNPKGSHSQGDVYLRIFIDEILHIDDFIYKNIIVDRERSIGGNGRLDLVIENDEYLLIIEVKIDAGDQDSQLKRYDQYGKSKGKKYKIYYLTLYGNEASDYSTGGNGNSINYTCLSFSSDVLNWIRHCIGAGRTPLLLVIRETLLQYTKLLEKITGQIDGGPIMELKELLLKGYNLEVAEQLVKAVPYARAELEYRFWKGLYDTYNSRIEGLGFKYSEDDFFDDKDRNEALDYIVEQRRKKGGEFAFEYSIGEYNNQKILFWFGQSGYEKTIYASIGIVEGDNNIRFDKWDKNILAIIERLGFTLSSNNKFRLVNSKLNFYDDSIYQLKDENTFNQLVKSIGDQILDFAKSIKNDKELWKYIK